MQGNEYQNLCWETAKPFYKERAGGEVFKNLQLVAGVLALTGEAGELANKLKKMVEAGDGILNDEKNREALVDELGDTLWYVAHVATLLGVKLEDVMGYNIAKLRERYGKRSMVGK